MKHLSILFSLIILLTSCKIYEVSTDEKVVAGIPFLSKKVVLEQQTTYVQPFYDASLEIVPMKGDSIAPGATPLVYPVKRTKVHANDKLTSLYSMLQNYDRINSDQLIGIVITYNSLPPIDSQSIPNPVSNTLERKIVVDTLQYYLNSRKSFFGRSSLNFELNADNTLTKGIVEDETNLTELLTSFLPISGIISKVFDLDNAEAEEMEEHMELNNYQDDPSELDYKVTLKVEGGIYQYTFVKNVSNIEDAFIPIDFDLRNGLFTKVESKVAGKKTEVKKEDNSIKLNGSITFPESKKE